MDKQGRDRKTNRERRELETKISEGVRQKQVVL